MINYIPGTKIQRRTGHIYIKTIEMGLIKEARYLVMLRENRDLDKNERVFFKDGNRENVEYSNLASIHFSETRFKYLPKSRVIYLPKSAKPVGRPKMVTA